MEPVPGNRVEIVLYVLDGRDGETRWSWHDRWEEAWKQRGGGVVCLANFRGHADSAGFASASPIPVVGTGLSSLTLKGSETARRDVSKGQLRSLTAADVNGDGRDELLLSLDHGLQVVGGDLKEIWSLPQEPGQVGFVNLPRAGRRRPWSFTRRWASTAANGRPRWAGDDRGYPFNIWRVALLDRRRCDAAAAAVSVGLGAGLLSGVTRDSRRHDTHLPGHTGAARARPGRPAVDQSSARGRLDFAGPVGPRAYSPSWGLRW